MTQSFEPIVANGATHAPPKSPNRKILHAALIVGLLTLTAKFGTTIKELVVAQWFGRNDDLDAFLIAFLLPSFVLNVVVGAIGSALIPSFVATRRNEGMEAAQKLFASIMLIALGMLTVVAILLGVLAPLYLPYLGSSFSAEKLHLTRNLLYLLLPFILFNGISTCASAALNAVEKFAIPALAPLLTPLITILLIELGAARWGAFSLAAGVVAGSVLEAALTLTAVRARGMRFSLRWDGLSPGVRSVLAQYTPMLAATFLASGTSVVDQSMAAMLRPGSVAALSYANKIVTVVSALGVTALGTALLPYLSKMVVENDWNGIRHTLRRYSVLVASISIPVTLVLMACAKPLVRLLFQRGAFTSADTNLVSWVQVCYAIQIPFYIWLTLYVRFLSAIRRNDVLMYGGGMFLVLDIVLNLILMRVMGIAGIALSTSLVYLFAFLFLSIWSVRHLARQTLVVTAVSPAPGAAH